MALNGSHAVSSLASSAVPPSILSLLSPLLGHIPPEDNILHVAYERALS